MGKVVMGIDQSLSCTGVVILEEKGGIKTVLYHEAITTEKDPDATPMADTLTRAKYIAKQLADLQLVWDPDQIVLESLSFGSVGNATRNLAILFGIICVQLGLDDPDLVTPTSLKKYATSSGRANKKEMLAAIEQVNPELFSELNSYTIKQGKYDIADAFWIATWIL